MISKQRRRRDSRFALIAASLALVPATAAGASVEKDATVAFADPGCGCDPASGEIALLKAGLDAIEAMDIGGARRIRDRLPEKSIDRHILAWALAFERRPTEHRHRPHGHPVAGLAGHDAAAQE